MMTQFCGDAMKSYSGAETTGAHLTNWLEDQSVLPAKYTTCAN
jgi:hypothetical protein